MDELFLKTNETFQSFFPFGIPTFFCSNFYNTQFTTNHGNFKGFLSKIGAIKDSSCHCGNEFQDSRHLLLECPLFSNARQETINNVVDLYLFGYGSNQYKGDFDFIASYERDYGIGQIYQIGVQAYEVAGSIFSLHCWGPPRERLRHRWTARVLSQSGQVEVMAGITQHKTKMVLVDGSLRHTCYFHCLGMEADAEEPVLQIQEHFSGGEHLQEQGSHGSATPVSVGQRERER
ncbi:hypothetical protein LAZ67_13002102 [Cordylochernes scorpioides]|uniref:Uncharacterized protein n=1 Tax=Cordylochernes scorpioides TaxID=51811 RepID=A0ABY6L7V2_9ARAC|nr:hypothetical protein LAZ67_13002102 [Cordylochernes scorpioides]